MLGSGGSWHDGNIVRAQSFTVDGNYAWPVVENGLEAEMECWQKLSAESFWRMEGELGE